MKILFAITKSNFGGAQKYVYELAVKYKELGHEVHVCAGGQGVLKDKLAEAGITVHHIDGAQRDINILKEFKVAINLFRIIHKVGPDVVHLNSPKIGGLGALIASLLRVSRIIYTNHGWPFNEQRPLWQVAIIKVLSWTTLFLNQKTIVLSKIEKDQVSRWPLVSDKVVVIPNAIDKFDLMTKEDAVRELEAIVGQKMLSDGSTINLSDGSLVVGSIGELHNNKGYTYAIEGIKSFVQQYPETKIKYLIIGEGDERENLERLISEAGLKNIVLLAGQVSNARTYMKAFDLFLISSVKEGLPYVLLEAGYAEVPVITTSVGGIPEVVENLKQALIIAPKRHQQIKNAIFYSIEHRADLKKISKTFKQKVNTDYNFKKLSDEILKIYTIS